MLISPPIDPSQVLVVHTEAHDHIERSLGPNRNRASTSIGRSTQHALRTTRYTHNPSPTDQRDSISLKDSGTTSPQHSPSSPFYLPHLIAHNTKDAACTQPLRLSHRSGSLFGAHTIAHISNKVTGCQRDSVAPKMLSHWIRVSHELIPSRLVYPKSLSPSEIPYFDSRSLAGLEYHRCSYYHAWSI
jgi:hypothetical protein